MIIVYDELKKDIFYFEKKYKFLNSDKNSPSLKLSDLSHLKIFKKVTHKAPMLIFRQMLL